MSASRHDSAAAVIWIVAGGGIAGWSATFPFGSLKAPGPGLLPFACGVALTVLGAVLLVQAVRAVAAPATVSLFTDRAALARMVATLGAVAAAGVLIDRLGFTTTVFILMLFLLRGVARLRWAISVVYAVSAAAACLLLFQRVLGVELPRGWVGF